MKIVFCLPGNNFSSAFFKNWISFNVWLNTRSPWVGQRDFLVMISSESGSDVCTVRERCLGVSELDSVKPDKIPPFYGRMDYDYIMWIDSDIIFKPQDFVNLVNRDVDIVSGLYKRYPDYYTAVRYVPSATMDILNGLHVDEVKDEVNLIETYFAGMGFTLVKKGVFESLERPWFQHTVEEFLGTNVALSEDAYFCLKARQAGFKVYVDPTVKVGHQKLSVNY